MKHEMTSRERIPATLARKETDRLPWAPLVDPFFISSVPLQGWHTDLLATARDVIGCDLIERHVASPISHVEGLSVRENQRGSHILTEWDTPLGTLRQEEQLSGNTRYVTKHFLESRTDLLLYGELCRRTTYTPDLAAFTARGREIGDAGTAAADGNMSLIQELLQYKAGVENTVYLQMDYPDEMAALLEAMHLRNLRQYAALAEYPTEVIFDYEDTSTTVISPTMFARWSAPPINAYAGLMHQAGKLFITHMCGKLTGFASMIGEGIQDGIGSVCPAPTGDLAVWDARLHWPDKLLIGGIDPPSLARWTPVETLNSVCSVLLHLNSKRGFLLSTGDAVAYATPMENLRIISALLRRLGPRSAADDLTEEELSAAVQSLLSLSGGAI